MGLGHPRRLGVSELDSFFHVQSSTPPQIAKPLETRACAAQFVKPHAGILRMSLCFNLLAREICESHPADSALGIVEVNSVARELSCDVLRVPDV